MKPTLLHLAGRLALAALLLGIAAPRSLAAPTDPPGSQIDPSTAVHGGDGVGGIEHTASNKPTLPTNPTTPGGGNGPIGPGVGETTSPAPEQGWNDLGGGLPTVSNTPALSGSGDGSAGSRLELDLLDARPLALTTLVVGVEAGFQPFKGGTLVPAPGVILTGLLTDDVGELHLQGMLEQGLPEDATLVFQLWTVDPEAVQGLSASNGELLLVP
ncbi:MAG TPA: hypothetical protein VFY71_02265 [Planctomycetota bacterium]|nr:hypothetical protein [Planctomycetota bacterium]